MALHIDGGVPADGVVIAVRGDVDAVTAPLLLAALSRAVSPGSSVCCDLSAVGFFGADGARVLAIAHLEAARARGGFTVRGVRGTTAAVLRVTGLDSILTILG